EVDRAEAIAAPSELARLASALHRCGAMKHQMNNMLRYACGAVVFAAIVLFPGCSTGQQSPVQLSSNGPTIVNARSAPTVVVLNRDLQPNQPAEFLADVKDFKSNILDVRLKFSDVPMEIPMENIGGTTWKDELTPQQLQQLAISGKTVKYQASIIARNTKGDTATSTEPVTVAIETPDLGAQYG